MQYEKKKSIFILELLKGRDDRLDRLANIFFSNIHYLYLHRIYIHLLSFDCCPIPSINYP